MKRHFALAMSSLCLTIGTSLAPASAQDLVVFEVPGTSGFIGTQAFGINSRGDVVGTYVTNELNTHGFLRRKDGAFITIDHPEAVFPAPPTSGGTDAWGVNARGDIVGSFRDAAGAVRGYLLADGVFTNIDAPGSASTVPTAISPQGDIVGAYSGSTGHSVGFLLSEGSFTTIDVPGSVYLTLTSINARRDIVGYYYDNRGRAHGFLLADGAMSSIEVPGGIPGTTQPFGINASGDIVGAFGDANDFYSGWVLRNGAFTAPLLPELDPLTCGCNAVPSAINSRGDIAGVYFGAAGIQGFLLVK